MKSVPLKQVANVSMGTAPPGSTYNAVGNGIPMIAGAGDFAHQYPNPKKWTTAPTRIAKKGDLVVCIRATIGDQNWADKTYCLGRGVAGIRSIDGKSDIGYIAKALQAFEGRLRALGRGANFKALRKSDLENFEIPLPPLEEQKRIASVLDKADALRRLRQQSIDLTEKLIESVFLDMFGDPVENPKKWPVRRLAEFGNIQTGNTPPRSDSSNYSSTGIEWIKTDNIPEERRIVEQAVERLSEKGYRLARAVPADSILVTCIAGSEKSIGRAALTDREVAFNQQINAITPYRDTSPIFLYYMLKISRRHIQDAAGVGMKKLINKSTFENLVFISPPFDNDQQKFENTSKKIIGQLDRLNEQSPYTEALYASLQHRAFRGDLDLSNLILDEEAEEFIQAADKLGKLVNETLPRTLGRGISLKALKPSAATEKKLKDQDKAIEESGQIQWSRDFFKFRLLARQSTKVSITDLMSQAESVFTEPNYDAIRDILFDYLDSGQGKPVLTQTFDEKRKEIILQPA